MIVFKMCKEVMITYSKLSQVILQTLYFQPKKVIFQVCCTILCNVEKNTIKTSEKQKMYKSMLPLCSSWYPARPRTNHLATFPPKMERAPDSEKWLSDQKMFTEQLAIIKQRALQMESITAYGMFQPCI